MGSKDINLKDDYYSSIERLSFRTQKVLNNQFGGIEKMLEHYIKKVTFLDIENVGGRTNMELCSFSNYILKNNFEKNYTINVKELNNDSETVRVQYYLEIKNQYSLITNQILDKIESFYINSGHVSIDDNFINKYFNSNYDFSVYFNLDSKQIKDLVEIKFRIGQKFNFFNSINNIDIEYEKLSTVVKKVINMQLGGKEKMLEYYIQNKSFRRFPNIGTYINIDLCNYCNYIINKEHEKVENISTIDNTSHKELLTNYLIIKKQYSVRIVNVLDKLEEQYKKLKGHDIDEGFIDKYFIDKFDYNTIVGIGAKSVDELKEIRDKIHDRLGITDLELNSIINNISVFELFENHINIKEQ